ncbi:MAG: hydrogenase maturation protease [Polyangia bacterium]|jgi:hydrogenase maturation protease
MRTIIIGVGNPIRTDDAAGLVAVRLLRERLPHDGDVDVEELWAGGLRLVEAMVGYQRAIIVDAMATGGWPPGTVRRLTLAELGGARNLTCVHDTSLPTALAIWRASSVSVPQDIAIFGIEGLDLETLGEDLSTPVRRGVEMAVDAIVQELRVPQRSAT